ncbi:hypothetical protein GWK47_020367 [Chionoecetes opilio]|uniref:FANCI solenoid 2 domain-containing protein n=1 Tax=Chionoecetes opilio TaxID=41210 RepID=A0A8J4XPU5_CHIOP|nr:hypothetical protein GWK47_020367 [Chionoecetes opilio]
MGQIARKMCVSKHTVLVWCRRAQDVILEKLVRTVPLAVLDHQNVLRDILEYLEHLSLGAATHLLLALNPLLKMNMALKDALMIILRKMLFSRNMAKAKRNSGEEYVSVKTGRRVESRQIGTPCRDGCFDKATLPVIRALFSDFWAMANYDAQTAYIQKLVHKYPVVRMRQQDFFDIGVLKKHVVNRRSNNESASFIEARMFVFTQSYKEGYYIRMAYSDAPLIPVRLMPEYYSEPR